MVCALCATQLGAQGWPVEGSVQTRAGHPVFGARVTITSLARSTETRADGKFTLTDIAAGSHEIEIRRIGYRSARITILVAPNSHMAPVNVVLEATALRLDPMVTSVSARPQPITRAPAAVTYFDAEKVASTLGNPTTVLLQQAPGIDLTQVGVTSSTSNGRGFNSRFNTRWLTMEDGRIAVFPETGLPISASTTIPKIDIASLEVIAGPESALYGANASSGVLSVTTRDPRTSKGLSIELIGGTQRFGDLQVRFADAIGRWAYKVAGEYQAATEWPDTLFYASTTPGNPPLRESTSDRATVVKRINTSARYYSSSGRAHVGLNAGASVRDGLTPITPGRFRLDGYTYNDAQLYFRSPDWFVQAYRAHSNAGDTYRLNFQTYAQAAAPLLSADSVRSLSRYPVDGITEVIEMQNNLLVGALAHSGVAVLDSSRVTWGLQARRSAASSRGVVFNDVVNGPPIVINQQAAYAQIESRPAPSLHLVLAARYDHHPHLDARISPKLGLLYDIDASRVVRLTYNGAFVAPGILQMEARTINAGAGTAGVGNGYGFTIKDASGTTVNQIARLRPELNETWELGFKGLVTSQLSADATVYMTHVHNFMTLTGPFNNVRAAAPTFAYYGKTGARITDNAGNPLALVTYINVGDGRFSGLDAALRYSLTDRVLITSTASVTRVIKIHSRPQDPPDATAFNSSGFRTVLQMEYENPGRGLSLSARTRYVKGYEFRSGVDWGRIPTFGTLGASASWRVQKSGVTLLAQAENIATCVSGTTTPPVSGINFASRSTYLSHRECGIDFQHRELMNMPAVGMTIFGGVRWERR